LLLLVYFTGACNHTWLYVSCHWLHYQCAALLNRWIPFYCPFSRYAVSFGKQDAMVRLLQHGAEPNVRNKEGNSLFLQAIVGGQRDIAEMILAQMNPAAATEVTRARVMKNRIFKKVGLGGGRCIPRLAHSSAHTSAAPAPLNTTLTLHLFFSLK